MNVKFVGRIIMTVLFVFICIGAHAGDDLSLIHISEPTRRS